MESIYYVMCWQCHRQCVHCYEDRFRPYHGEDLERIVGESRVAFPRIIGNLPERMTYLDAGIEKRGRIILAGGEILHKAVREPILYPAMELIYRRYRDVGGVEIVVQTTGDLVTDSIVTELVERHVDKISVSGLDDYHEGLDADGLRAKLTEMFESHGAGYSFFGATPESWIGKLWPRGRAQLNELSTADLSDNFCNRWSGGLNFLRYRMSGSEVSIDPEGNVYPCCIKTKKAIGSLIEETLEGILDRLTGDPVYEAISLGQPERMGIAHGWSVEKFLAKSVTTLASGRRYRNLCIGCDAFHEEVLMDGSGALVTIEAA